MLIFNPVDPAHAPKVNRLMWGGIRDDAPTGGSFLHVGTKRTFQMEINSPKDEHGRPINSILPVLIAWENIRGDEKAVYVDDTERLAKIKDRMERNQK